MSTIRIEPMNPTLVPAVSEMITAVAYGIYGHRFKTVEDFNEMASGELVDISAYEAEYLQHRGAFFVALDGNQVIGSGALRGLDEARCEVKRLWVLEAYHGQRVGYRLMQVLMNAARQQDFREVCLATGAPQVRAQAFYRRLGFKEIKVYPEAKGDVFFGMKLEDFGVS